MRLEELHIHMQVVHPQYGLGIVKAIHERTADISFSDGIRSVDPVLGEIKPATATATLNGLTLPLEQLIRKAVAAALEELGVGDPLAQQTVDQLGDRWRNGLLLIKPSNPELAPKDIPLEVFFHKVVMIRDNLRILEQKVNAHKDLSDAQKVEMQQYITKIYGSLTTFNILFKERSGNFGG